MEGLLGPKLLRGSAEVGTSSALCGGYVGLYFSAHWCGPCRGYTPQLAKVYDRARRAGKALDIVFVSSDQDEASFREYFASMPWLALPFADRARKEALSASYQVRGIPTLVLLGPRGELLDANARPKAMEPGFPSRLPRLIELAPSHPEPTEAVPLRLRHRGQELEIECDPSEGWELLKMQIFSMTEVPAEQQRLFGLGVAAGPLDESVPLPKALAAGLAQQRHSGLEVADVPAESRSASSTWQDEAVGQPHHAGRLDSRQAWSNKSEDTTPWYQMDLGSVRRVAGVVVAPRANMAQWVTRFKVSVADAEAGPWRKADGGNDFEGCSSMTQDPVRMVFQSFESCRFVRIEPTAFSGHCSLRADVLLEGSSKDLPPIIVVLGNFSAEDPFEVTPSVPGAGNRLLEEQHLALLQAKLSSLPPKLQHQVHSLDGVKKYEDRALQRHALDEIPVLRLDEAASKCAGGEGYEVAFMRHLLRWFKHSFFTWTNTPKCEHCGSANTQSTGSTQPNQMEQHYGAGNVEVAKCNACAGITRFPRYNDPAKLLETRQGRCGEWANCFTLVCRALGYEARLVNDWTDHVWTEIYSDSKQCWLHADSCEAALDTPLVYEQGWGKKLTYCLAFARDHAVDVTRRYSRTFESAVLSRRKQFSEAELKRAMAAISDFALDRSLGELPASAVELRRSVVENRLAAEAVQLTNFTTPAPKPEEQVGRTSGDAEWREQRGELGATAAAKQEALLRSEKGLDAAAACAAPAPAPAQAEAPAAATASPEADKDAFKKRFAELVASGMSPNEAAVKVLQEAKQAA